MNYRNKTPTKYNDDVESVKATITIVLPVAIISIDDVNITSIITTVEKIEAKANKEGTGAENVDE